MTKLRTISLVACALLCLSCGRSASAGLVIQSVVISEDTSLEGFHTFVVELRAGDDGLTPISNVGSFSFLANTTQPVFASSIIVPPSNNGVAWGEFNVSQTTLASGFSFSGLYSPVAIAFPPRRDITWAVGSPEALMATVSYTFAISSVPVPVAFDVTPTTPSAPGFEGIPAGFVEYVESGAGTSYVQHNSGFDSPGTVGGVIRAVPEPTSVCALFIAVAGGLLRRRRSA